MRPRLTLKILLYALLDVAGMVLFASGALWLIQKQSLFINGFPANLAEGVVGLLAGLLLMFWAAAKILRELIKRPDDTLRNGR
jgi:hypothetical protein